MQIVKDMETAEEFKGTKGIWEVLFIEFENYDILCVGREDTVISQQTFGGKATEEMRANAQLIAAAPEILKELIDFCKTFESTIGYQGYDHNVFVALNDRYIQSKKAIKKALGK